MSHIEDATFITTMMCLRYGNNGCYLSVLLDHSGRIRYNTIDPMTGNDIVYVTSYSSLVDGNLTMYFETDAIRMAYICRLIIPICTCLTRAQTVMTVEAETY